MQRGIADTQQVSTNPPRADLDALVCALDALLFDMHPVYGSTSGPYHGVGGAAMTTWCHVTDDRTPIRMRPRYAAILARIDAVLIDAQNNTDQRDPLYTELADALHAARLDLHQPGEPCPLSGINHRSEAEHLFDVLHRNIARIENEGRRFTDVRAAHSISAPR